MAARAGAPAYSFYGHGGGEEIQPSGPNSRLSQMLLAFSPRSCITSNLDGGLLDFSNGAAPAPAPELWNQQSDNSSEQLNHGDHINSSAEAARPQQDAQDVEGKKSDLRSRGMCLVPVSCITSRLGADNTSDFWQPAPPLSDHYMESSPWYRVAELAEAAEADDVPDLEEEEWADAEEEWPDTLVDLKEQGSAEAVADDLEERESIDAVEDFEEESADAMLVALER
ncbi:hypothetical protein TRIUR3_32113 [Triticum urartu]|uniref:Uncharacterized protein n=1 Tax=Triticum urartu TaxID=4572 RepID=M7ZIT9_TRIUA|nr:hypothetical protein TRIUR3_32113 [Triticum urartu]